MLIFIDDSGDPGFKLTKGSSQFFVIACIVFDDELEAEKTAVAIKELKRKLGYRDNEEFKFNNSRDSTRKFFLETVSEFNFRVRCIVVNKSLVHSPELKSNKASFYSYFIKEVLKKSKGKIQEGKIKLDGHGGRDFTRNLASYLRREVNDTTLHIIKSVKMVDSKENVLIQLADMIAGAIGRSYSKPDKSGTNFRKIITKRIDDCWEFK